MVVSCTSTLLYLSILSLRYNHSLRSIHFYLWNIRNYTIRSVHALRLYTSDRPFHFDSTLHFDLFTSTQHFTSTFSLRLFCHLGSFTSTQDFTSIYALRLFRNLFYRFHIDWPVAFFSVSFHWTVPESS